MEHDEPNSFAGLAEAVQMLRRDLEKAGLALAQAEARADAAVRERNVFRAAMLEAYRLPKAQR